MMFVMTMKRGFNCNHKVDKNTVYLQNAYDGEVNKVDQNLCKKREIAAMIQFFKNKYNIGSITEAKNEFINSSKQYSKKNCFDASTIEQDEILNIANTEPKKKQQPKKEVVNESKE